MTLIAEPTTTLPAILTLRAGETIPPDAPVPHLLVQVDMGVNVTVYVYPTYAAAEDAVLFAHWCDLLAAWAADEAILDDLRARDGVDTDDWEEAIYRCAQRGVQAAAAAYAGDSRESGQWIVPLGAVLTLHAAETLPDLAQKQVGTEDADLREGYAALAAAVGARRAKIRARAA